MYSLVRYDKLLYNKPDLQKINYVKWKKSKYTTYSYEKNVKTEL